MNLMESFKKNKHQFIIELVNIIILLSFLITFIVIYPSLDKTIRVQENGGSCIREKSTTLVLPIVCLIIFALVTVIQYLPLIWKANNFDANNNLAIKYMREMIGYAKLIFTSLFFLKAYIALKSLMFLSAYTYIAILVALVVVLYYLFKLNKSYKKV